MEWRACRGVWPRVSRRGLVSLTGWSGGSSVMIMFSTLAVLPACRRTPLASYMTTMLKMRAIANSALLVPRITPTAVVNPKTCSQRDTHV